MKKELTTQEKYKRKALTLDIVSYSGFPIAFCVLLAIRGKAWVSGGITSSVQIGVGFVLALVVFVLAVMKKIEFLKGIWGWFLALGITYLLRTIINELWIIVLALTCAEFLYWILTAPREEAHKQCSIAQDTTIQEKVKKDLAEEYNGRV